MRVLAVVAFVALVAFIVWLMYHNDRCLKKEITRMNEEADENMEDLLNQFKDILASNENNNLGQQINIQQHMSSQGEGVDEVLNDNVLMNGLEDTVEGETLFSATQVNEDVNKTNDSVMENPGNANLNLMDNLGNTTNEEIDAVGQQMLEDQDEFANQFNIPQTGL